jgi:hypothetical protein
MLDIRSLLNAGDDQRLPALPDEQVQRFGHYISLLHSMMQGCLSFNDVQLSRRPRSGTPPNPTTHVAAHNG